MSSININACTLSVSSAINENLFYKETRNLAKLLTEALLIIQKTGKKLSISTMQVD